MINDDNYEKIMVKFMSLVRNAMNLNLVGGLVAMFYFPIYWVAFIIPIDGPYFSEGWPNHQPVEVAMVSIGFL